MSKKLLSFSALCIAVAFIVTGCASTTTTTKTPVAVKTLVSEDALAKQSAFDASLKKEVSAKHPFAQAFVALNPYGNAPLSAVVIFETNKATTVHLKVTGHDASTDINHDFPAATSHVIPVYGLYAGEDNAVILTLGDGIKRTIQIKTEDVTKDYMTATLIKSPKDKSIMEKGWDFVTPDDKPIAAYDSNGEMRWNLTNIGIAREVRALANGRFLIPSFRKDNANTVLGVTEIDLMGKIYSDYIVNGGNHHDTYEMPNGNLLVCSANYTVFEINRTTGAVEKTFNVNDLIPKDDGGSLINNGNWFHNNSVWYDQKSDTILLSGRRNNAVLGVSYSTGKLKWILSDPEGWTQVDKKLLFKPIGKNFEWQYAQHSAHMTPEGYVFLFDNGRVRAKVTSPKSQIRTGDTNFSRAVMYKIDTKKMTIEQVWQFGKERGPSWYSVYISNVMYFAKGHYYANSGGLLYDTANKTYEVDENISTQPGIRASADVVEIINDKVIYEIKFNKNIYQVVRLAPYRDAMSFDLDYVGKVVGTLNPDTLAVESNLNISNAKAPDFFKVTAIQDPIRVLITGTWDVGKAPKDAKVIIKTVGQETYASKAIAPPNATAAIIAKNFGAQISTAGFKAGQYDVLILADGVLYNPGIRFEIK